jgi:EAL domain-containing protein (putative c-di-GMP-specific phosphodiesterase class I)
MAMLRLADAALRDDRIVPHYQPKVDLRDGRLVGLEALLRWHGHDGSIHLPDEIEGAFGDPVLGPRLSERMTTRIIADVSSWRAAGLPCNVAINCASVDVLDEAFADRLLRRLRQVGLPPSSIELEITEDVLLTASPARVEGNLQRLSAAGARIALDDFGTGFASLTHLKRFPVNTIKIDRSFVCNVLDDRGDRAIVAALANLATSLEIEIVAEGVEHPAQADALRAMGCGVGQGFLFGKAEPADLARARLAQQAGRCQKLGRFAA